MNVLETKSRISGGSSFNRKRNLQVRRASYQQGSASTGENRKMGRRSSTKLPVLTSEDDDNLQLFEKTIEKHAMDIWLNKKATTEDVFGGRIHVPANKYNPRKDYITAKKVTPTEIHRYLPELSPYEHLAGDVFEFATNRKTLKDPVTLTLPVNIFNRSNLFEVKMKVRLPSSPSGASDESPKWQYVEGIRVVDENQAGEHSNKAHVEFDTPYLGVFAPVLSSAVEVFTVTEQGMLYTAKLNHYISLRFPKRAIQDTMDVALRIIPLNEDKIDLARVDYKDQLQDFEQASGFYSLQCPDVTFKRGVTVKLPLPATGFSSEHHESICVVCKGSSAKAPWRLVEGALKFTTTTVSFETRTLGQYCIVRGHPKRKQRIPNSIAAIDHLNWRWKRDVIVFTKIVRKAWNVWVELSSPDATLALIDKRESEGMTCVYRPSRFAVDDKTGITTTDGQGKNRAGEPEPVVQSYAQLMAKSRRSSSLALEEAMKPPPPAHESAGRPAILVAADNKVAQISRAEAARLVSVHLNSTAPHSYRCFEIEPLAEQYDTMSAVLTLYTDDVAVGIGGAGLGPKRDSVSSGNVCSVGGERMTVATVTIPITREMMQDYFYIPPEAVEEPMMAEVPEEVTGVEEKKDEPKAKRIFSPEYMARLTISRRAKQILCKEPKVLSGRSLQTLSRQIEEGLTLAVHLQIPDSTITGIGFDALSNGLSLSEVTYKILLRWKRMPALPDVKMAQLTNALKAMGRHDIVAVLWQYHGDNKELIPGVFSQPSESDDEITYH